MDPFLLYWSHVLRSSQKNRKPYLKRFKQNWGGDKGTNISSFLLENEGRRKTIEKLKFSEVEKRKRKDPAKKQKSNKGNIYKLRQKKGIRDVRDNLKSLPLRSLSVSYVSFFPIFSLSTSPVCLFFLFSNLLFHINCPDT